jgi:succinate-semialdehyde dehydrogenase/glutarate-semialdehyde dehydrogenase
MAAKFRNAGQTCVCADRLLVHSSVHDEFVEKLAEKVEKLQVGPGMDKRTTMGPLITAKAVQNVQQKVNDAVAAGASCVVGGKTLTTLGPHFFEPTLLTGVSTDSDIWKTETFGPVAPIVSFDTEEEALALANDSPVGLAAYFCSQDLSRAFRFASR